MVCGDYTRALVELKSVENFRKGEDDFQRTIRVCLFDFVSLLYISILDTRQISSITNDSTSKLFVYTALYSETIRTAHPESDLEWDNAI